MKALVTGGCGFVGRHLVRSLIDKGFKITIVDDLSTGIHPVYWVKNNSVKFIKGDVRDFFKESDENFDYVFHLAAIVGGRTKIDGAPLLVAENMIIDIIFFNWIMKTKPKYILYPSSSAVYPVDLQNETHKKFMLGEYFVDVTKKKIGFPDMTYGWSKMTAEFLAYLTWKSTGLNIKVIRPFTGYGEGQDGSYPTTAIAIRALSKQDPIEVWGPEWQGRDFVHIDDVISAIWIILEQPPQFDVFNIATGEVTTFNEIAMKLAKIVGYETTVKNLVNMPTGVLNRVGDPTKLKKLGWKPLVSIDEGLARVVDWLKTGVVI